MSDLNDLFRAEDEVKLRRVERENASARLELAQMRRNMALLLSQNEPIASSGIDREKLRAVIRFIQHGNVKILTLNLNSLKGDA